MRSVGVLDTHGFDGDFNLNTRRSACVLILRISRIVHGYALYCSRRTVAFAILVAAFCGRIVNVERIVCRIRTRHCEYEFLEILACRRFLERTVGVFVYVVDVFREIKVISAIAVARVVSLLISCNNVDIVAAKNTAHCKSFARAIGLAASVAGCTLGATVKLVVGIRSRRLAAAQFVKRNPYMRRCDLSDGVRTAVNRSHNVISHVRWIGKRI